MRPARWLAGASIVAALAAGGWWTAHRVAPVPETAKTAASSASERLPKAVPVVEPATPPLAAPAQEGPLADLAGRYHAQAAQAPSADFVSKRAALERRARDGDAVAAADLGNLLLTCDGHVEFADADVDTLLVEGLAVFGKEALQLPDGVPLDAVADATKREFARLRDTCAGSQGLSLSREERLGALEGLRRGARAGNPDAMMNFAQFAFQDFDDVREMIAHPERVRERKREARGYLERAIAAGNIEALSVAADAHHTGNIVEKSNELAYANFYAYLRAKSGGGADARAYQADLAVYGMGLTPEQVAQAQARGDAIYRACCAATPGGAR